MKPGQFIAIIIGVAVVVSLAGYGFYQTIENPTTWSRFQPPKIELKPPAPQSDPNASWHQVVKFKGRGPKKTPTFNVPGHEWMITWHTDPGKGFAGNFIVFVHRAEGDPYNPVGELAANVMGKDSDSTIIRGAGNYYLEINATQPYGIVVSARY